MKRVLSLLLAPALLAAAGITGAIAGGCGQASLDTKGVTVIRFWNGFTGPDGDTMRGIVKDFNVQQVRARDQAIREKRPAPEIIEVRMETIPWATYYDKVTLGLAFGGAPDLFVLHTSRFPEYASHDVLSPLDDDLKAAGLTPALYLPQTWTAASWKGTQFALPLDVHPMTLYYNLDMFAAAGIDGPPKTYAEFLADAKRLTIDKNRDGSPEQWGFAYTNLPTISTMFLNQYDTAMLTPDLQRSALNTPNALRAYDRMTEIIYKEKVAPAPGGQNAWLAFQSKKVAMVMEGVYMNASLASQAGLRYAAAEVPQFGPKPAVWAGSHMLVLPKNSDAKHRTAAWTFARYLSDHSVDWAKGGQVPARGDLRETPEFKALTVQATSARQLPHIVYEPASVSLNLVGTFKDSAMEKILNRLGPERQAISDADRRINTVLERQKGAQ